MLSEFVWLKPRSRSITEIAPPALLAVFRAIESRTTHQMAHRTKQRLVGYIGMHDGFGLLERAGLASVLYRAAAGARGAQ